MSESPAAVEQSIVNWVRENGSDPHADASTPLSEVLESLAVLDLVLYLENLLEAKFDADQLRNSAHFANAAALAKFAWNSH